MSLYRKKPVVIEAVEFKGSTSDVADINDWIAGQVYHESPIKTRDIRTMEIDTREITIPEGTITWIANPGDYIIKGVNGEFYPCKPQIFAKTYEKVEENES